MSPCYEAIKEFYGDRCARRSGVPLMNHIDEGIIILRYFGASQRVIDAFSIHPILQDDIDLIYATETGSIFDVNQISNQATLLAMEYRHVANRYLPKHCFGPSDRIDLSPVAAVNLMLVADKVQNRKDFIQYHRGTHPSSKKLEWYFDNWFWWLGIDERLYNNLARIITKDPS